MIKETITIDGAILEGGGQILRTAMSCSSIFNIPLIIENIRGNRSKPGLQNQHLAGVKLMKNICKANVIGDDIQSICLKFTPNGIISGDYKADSKTAGSVCLIIQSILSTLIFGSNNSNLILNGGTDADFAPPIDFYRYIVDHYLAMMNVHISINLIRRGFFPKGQGEVKIQMEPIKGFIKPINLTEQGTIRQVRAICFVAGTLPISMAKDMATHLVKNIKKHPNYRNLEIMLETIKEDSNKAFGNGSGCLLIVDTTTDCRFGFNIVGKRELDSQDMGIEVANQFVNFFDSSRGCVDPQMQDQILLFMALAKGLSVLRCNELSLHSKTCIYVLEKMTPVKFLIEEVNGSKDVVISCEGLAVENTNRML